MYYNNQLETEEERRKRLQEQSQTSQIPTPNKPLEQMSTREALEYAWDKSEAENNMRDNSQSVPQISVPSRKPRYAELNFDGKKLDWVENDEVKHSWQAMSGKPDYQTRDAMNKPNLGPIPEGNWYLPQQNLQNFSDLSLKDQAISWSGHGRWPGGTGSWGKYRVRLEPDTNTDTMGRKNIFMHGGSTFGSRGCVDLQKNMDDFVKKYKEYERDMLMRVKYPNNRW